MSSADIAALLTSLKLGGISVLVLTVLMTPLAWWLSRSRSLGARVVEAVCALPLVLPPTVMGFYLLVLLGPAGTLGAWWVSLTGSALTFSFTGLVIASCLHSLPFALQPLQNAFRDIGEEPLHAAMSLRASPLDTFWNVVVPQARSGYLTAAVLTFAHTLGEFGVLLMVGGNIPGDTRVASVAIYDHVEALDYASAHRLAAVLVGIAFVVLLCVYIFGRPGSGNRGFTVGRPQ